MKQKKVIPLTAWLVGTMIILACSLVTQATPTAIPSSTPLPPTVPPTSTPTEVPPPTSTLVPTPLEAAILYQDDFSSNTHNWDIGTDSTDTGSTETSIVDGQYVVNLTAKSEYYAHGISLPGFSGKNFIMSIDVTILDTTMKNTGDLWLSFDIRDTGTKYYDFRITDGESQLIFAQDKKDDVILWDWIKSSALKLDKGVTNNFNFGVSGETFTLYINDELAGSATDATHNESGDIYFIIMLSNVNDNLRLGIDNLIIRESAVSN